MTESDISDLNSILEEIFLMQQGRYEMDDVSTTRTNANDGESWILSPDNQMQYMADRSIYTVLTDPLIGDATYYEDLWVQFNPAASASAPSYANYKAGRVFVFSDEAVNEDQLPFVAQLPHSYKFGSNIEFHVHIVGEDNTACNFRWCVNYSMADINKVFPSTGQVCKNIANLGTTDAHNYADIGSVTPDPAIYGNFVSTAIIGTVFRNSTSASDTCNAKNVYLLQFDMHVEKDAFGSREETSKY
jgi:hypothetical protein